MRHAAWAALAAAFVAQAQAADVPARSPLLPAETAFIDTMDASNAVDLIESGLATSYDGRDREAWRRELNTRRARLDAELGGLKAAKLSPEDVAAREAIERSIAYLDALVPSDAPEHRCADASHKDIDYATLRGALVACFIEVGNRLPFEGRNINRAEARTLLAELDEPARRRAAFDALQPLWDAINADGAADSPYRRMIGMAAADAAKNGSELDTAARAMGIDVTELERWLVRILETWSAAAGSTEYEPWDFGYATNEGSRRLSARVGVPDLRPLNDRYYADLGADVARLGIVYDLAPRADKSSVAYTDFVRRGREVDGAWRPPVARVVGTYLQGGLGELNELVHETGHAVHLSAIHTRPAYMDWPAALFDEAFADVPSWSVYEPRWQQRYLGSSIPEAVSLRSLYGNVMLDVAWALFELRMLRDPRQDPNVVWTDITHRYLHIVAHPERPWWALRVQLVESPGYMVNYGLGAVLTAEMRDKVTDAAGVFDAGNPRWYPWLAAHLLPFGSERDTRRLMTDLLGRPVSPAALLRQLERLKGTGQ